jgi:hypothetical protein
MHDDDDGQNKVRSAKQAAEVNSSTFISFSILQYSFLMLIITIEQFWETPLQCIRRCKNK